MLTYANIYAVIFAIYGLWNPDLIGQFQQTIVAYGKIFFSSLTYLLDDANIITEKLCYANRMEVNMMPITFANEGEENIIKKIGGNPETRQFLENLGFVAGEAVTIISEIGGNLILSIKDSRVAVSKEMAVKIMI